MQKKIRCDMNNWVEDNYLGLCWPKRAMFESREYSTTIYIASLTFSSTKFIAAL